MGDKMIQHEVEQYLWQSAVLLRGVIDPGEYKSIIFPLMFFKRVSDVYDEEYQKALQESEGDKEYAKNNEFHRFQIPDGAHWNDIRKITQNVGRSLREAMTAIEKANPDKLQGIFGDTNWTNKDRLSDRILIDLIEHLSSINLSIANIPDDQFGTAYEFLIKKFADDSGHTAAEFYTNRTVVRLMTLIVNPKSHETIYDPTCGSGGLLLNAVLLAKEQKKEWRNIEVYGQEINLITSAIARMNMFIHGIEDFHIVRGDTLSNPAFIERDRVKQFDIVLANPPYSMKKWNQESWKNDPWKRNIYGTPPQGCADYAFFQHIICSLKEKTGRCAILWPHGILFRDAEKDMRAKLIQSDIIEAVIGLGPNLFYNSSMESCIVVCNKNKPPQRKGKIIFIDANKELCETNNFSYLSEANIKKIFSAYQDYKKIDDFADIVTLEKVSLNDFSLKVNSYIRRQRLSLNEDKVPFSQLIKDFQNNTQQIEDDFSKFKEEVKKFTK